MKQRVATLLDGVRPSGTQHVTWDARTREGSPAAPGLYFAVLRAAGAEVRQRVVLVGANDGMLHAFDDATGSEAWAFVPRATMGRSNWLIW